MIDIIDIHHFPHLTACLENKPFLIYLFYWENGPACDAKFYRGNCQNFSCLLYITFKKKEKQLKSAQLNGFQILILGEDIA